MHIKSKSNWHNTKAPNVRCAVAECERANRGKKALTHTHTRARVYIKWEHRIEMWVHSICTKTRLNFHVWCSKYVWVIIICCYEKKNSRLNASIKFLILIESSVQIKCLHSSIWIWMPLAAPSNRHGTRVLNYVFASQPKVFTTHNDFI